MNHLIKIILSITIAISLFAGAAFGHTVTRFFNVQVEELAPKGKASDISGVLILENRFKEEQFVVQIKNAAPAIRGDKTTRDWISDRESIKGGDNVTLPFKASLVNDGKHIVTLEILIFNNAGQQIGHQHKNLYFEVRNGEYRVSTYEELYVPTDYKRDVPKELKGIVANGTGRPIGNEPVIPLIKGPALSFDDRKLERHQLPEDEGSDLGKRPDQPILDFKKPDLRRLPELQLEKRKIIPRDQLKLKEFKPLQRKEDESDDQTALDWEKYAQSSEIEDPASLAQGASRFMTEALGVSTAEARATYDINGKFSYRGKDDALHPAWNWFVEVWWKKNNNSWKKLGTKYVNWDGTWSMSVNKSGFSGQNIHVLYRAGGYYLMPQNRQDNPYWWGDPVRTNISTNYDVGHRTANLSSSGTLAGLGEAYHSGLLFWWKFYDNNLNPERDNAIKLYYPNTWFNCDDLNWTDNDSDPWSCAWEDRVWLLPEHADNYTIQHELSHQLMSEYWNNQGPDGAGGAHNLSTCYNDGLALSEGFANAAPVWVLSGENAVNPQPGGFNIESPPSSTCNGDTNELWVAAIFWDLLDRPSDGQDILWFNNPAEVFAKVLKNGKKNGIKEYRTLYRNSASSGHEQYIDDIFNHNTVSVP